MVGISKTYIDEVVDGKGVLQEISFKNAENFNFAYDIVDVMAERDPDKMCMLWVDPSRNERRFTFKEISDYSTKTANYFMGLGIKKGDRVMLVLKRHYQFWFSILALHKIGAVVIPATHQLKEEDLAYRFESGKINGIVCTCQDDIGEEVDKAIAHNNLEMVRCMTGTPREGWRDFDADIETYPATMERVATTGSDPMLMFFTSGTTGYPKIVVHDFTYPLGHYITAKYWHHVNPDGIHFTLSDTGWGKALWGKLYGQWMCETAVFVYDMDTFVPHDFLSLFSEYPITTFCAPATAYRVFAKKDLAKYGISKLEHVTTAGEALSPEIWKQFYDKTGLKIMEGFGQTETTLTLCNLYGTDPKPGSMGKPSPMYHIDLVDEDGNPVADEVTGEVVVRVDKEIPFGLFVDYFGGTGRKEDVLYDGMYHSGDTAYRDKDGFFWFVGRNDDLIKSTGYRVGPSEVEAILMELPFIMECAVIGIPDPRRGQRVMAFVVLTEEAAGDLEAGKVGEREIKADIMHHCKNNMANYKCPRKLQFMEELPKTISGKVRRSELRKLVGLR